MRQPNIRKVTADTSVGHWTPNQLGGLSIEDAEHSGPAASEIPFFESPVPLGKHLLSMNEASLRSEGRIFHRKGLIHAGAFGERTSICRLPLLIDSLLATKLFQNSACFDYLRRTVIGVSGPASYWQ